MIKRLLYTLILLICISRLSVARPVCGRLITVNIPDFNTGVAFADEIAAIDTIKVKKPEPDDKKKIKEIARAKKQAKPEKLGAPLPADTLISKEKVKTKRQRRPEGLERPPEIPRRNN